MREIARTRLNRSFVTTVPKAVRTFLRLDWGDHILWCIKGDEIVVRGEGEVEKESQRRNKSER